MNEYENVRRVTYESGATFVPVCEKCGRFMKADAHIMVNDYTGLADQPNATCSKCGHVKMLFEGFYEWHNQARKVSKSTLQQSRLAHLVQFHYLVTRCNHARQATIVKKPTRKTQHSEKTLQQEVVFGRPSPDSLRVRGRSQRAAARLLRLPTHGQMIKILHGEIRDTPAMRAALVRADWRAARAWSMIKDDDQIIDRELVCKLIDDLEANLEQLRLAAHSGSGGAGDMGKAVCQREKR